jgi:hypothetical protein
MPLIGGQLAEGQRDAADNEDAPEREEVNGSTAHMPYSSAVDREAPLERSRTATVLLTAARRVTGTGSSPAPLARMAAAPAATNVPAR